MKNTVPPGTDSKLILPRFAVTILFVIARPNPVPVALLDVTKDVNSIGFISSGIPDPLSDIAIWIC